jgi:hypothetical protein
VQLAPAPVRQALVRAVADEGVPESERPRDVGVALDELGKAVPGFGVGRGRRVALEHVCDDRAREGGAEHRGPPEQGPVARREPVDPGGDERLDGVGHLLGRVERLLGRGELLQEQRVPGAALHECGELIVGQAPISGRGADELLRVVDGQRLETQGESRQRRGPLGGDEPALDRATRGARQPGPRGKLRPEVAKELGGRVVHPVDVLENQERGRVEQLGEKRADHTVKSCTAE